MAIDFMAIARGRQLARDQNWQDEVRANQRVQQELQRNQWWDQIDQMAVNRESQAYLAPLFNNLQAAISAGVSPADYFIQQREQMLADPGFTNASPEVQQQILTSLGNSVRSRVGALFSTGEIADAQRLGQAYGLTGPATPFSMARAQGDPVAMIEAVNQQYGTNLVVGEDGMVDVFGERVQPWVVADYLTRSGGQGSALYTLRSEIQQQRIAQEQQEEQMRALSALYGQPGGASVAPDGQPLANWPGGRPMTPADVVSQAIANQTPVADPFNLSLGEQALGRTPSVAGGTPGSPAPLGAPPAPVGTPPAPGAGLPAFIAPDSVLGRNWPTAPNTAPNTAQNAALRQLLMQMGVNPIGM